MLLFEKNNTIKLITKHQIHTDHGIIFKNIRKQKEKRE